MRTAEHLFSVLLLALVSALPWRPARAASAEAIDKAVAAALKILYAHRATATQLELIREKRSDS